MTYRSTLEKDSDGVLYRFYPDPNDERIGQSEVKYQDLTTHYTDYSPGPKALSVSDKHGNLIPMIAFGTPLTDQNSHPSVWYYYPLAGFRITIAGNLWRALRPTHGATAWEEVTA